jgi:hypothetical protein
MVKFQWIACGLVMAVALSATGAETTDVVASQNLSINRGKDKPGKKASVHPKDASENIKSPLDRFVMLRFDSEAFDKDVRRAALQLEPVTFDGDQPMRFRVYAVRDGDAEDEQFEEDTYDPSAEGTLFDPGRELMLDTRQLLAIGTFRSARARSCVSTRTRTSDPGHLDRGPLARPRAGRSRHPEGAGSSRSSARSRRVRRRSR